LPKKSKLRSEACFFKNEKKKPTIFRLFFSAQSRKKIVFQGSAYGISTGTIPPKERFCRPGV